MSPRGLLPQTLEVGHPNLVLSVVGLQLQSTAALCVALLVTTASRASREESQLLFLNHGTKARVKRL